jgi:hypothetical protein
MPEDIPKTVGAGSAGKVRDEISEELVCLAADVAKHELAHRYGGHLEEPYATPGCGVFEPPLHGALSRTITEGEINLQTPEDSPQSTAQRSKV